jgi:hypothetical protein
MAAATRSVPQVRERERAISCWGCGKGITHQPTNRYNMLSSPCDKVLAIWKRLASQRFQELNHDVDINKLLVDDGGRSVGRMCRLCFSALQRLEKLDNSVRENMKKAVECIMSEDQWSQLQSRRQRLESSDDTSHVSLITSEYNTQIAFL